MFKSKKEFSISDELMQKILKETGASTIAVFAVMQEKAIAGHVHGRTSPMGMLNLAEALVDVAESLTEKFEDTTKMVLGKKVTSKKKK